MSHYLTKQEVFDLLMPRYWFSAFNGWNFFYVIDNPKGIAVYACKKQEHLFDVSESLFIGEIESEKFLYDKNEEMWWTKKELMEWQKLNCKNK